MHPFILSLEINDYFSPNISVFQTELWCCDEVAELDSCSNGGILCLLPLKSWVLSAHSDGTMKV